jgi:hypothetical protein
MSNLLVDYRPAEPVVAAVGAIAGRSALNGKGTVGWRDHEGTQTRLSTALETGRSPRVAALYAEPAGIVGLPHSPTKTAGGIPFEATLWSPMAGGGEETAAVGG